MLKKQHRQLSVLMNGVLVGRLEKLHNTSMIFSYTQNWLALSTARPLSLSMPLTAQAHQDDVVYHFFDNLLPDNPVLRNKIQAKFQAKSIHPFDLLACIGRDCVGAIQVVEEDDFEFSKHILCEPLKEKALASLLRDYSSNPLGMSDNDDFRISIAGAQEKSAFLWFQNAWHRPLGTTPTSHIFKLPIGYIQHQQIDLSDSCENEWLCSKILSEFGLPVANCSIETFEDVKVLVVERFDRKYASDASWIMRLPQEDMCQAMGVSPNLKYQVDGGPGIKDILKLLLGSSNATQDRDDFFRTQVIFWLLAAIDGHAKNFSIHITAGGRFNLTPLYDVMSAYPLIAKKQLQIKKIKMAMSLEGKNRHYKWSEIKRCHFLQTAKISNYSIKKADNIIAEVLDQVDSVISRVEGIVPEGFPIEVSEPIFSGMRKARKLLS